mgnify:CR=1 FL=1
MSFIDSEAIKLTELLVPWISILISIIVALWLKDFAQNFMIGLKFRMNGAFNEGDKVLLGGKDAIIVKIGLRDTVFGVYSDKGYTWRYVPNERIAFLKLEKIVDADLHRDSDLEKAQRIIDQMQTTDINNNKKAIDKINNGKK